MQAAVASLFDLELGDVPNFIEDENGALNLMQFFFDKCGEDITYVNKGKDDTPEFMKKNRKI